MQATLEAWLAFPRLLTCDEGFICANRSHGRVSRREELIRIGARAPSGNLIRRQPQFGKLLLGWERELHILNRKSDFAKRQSHST